MDKTELKKILFAQVEPMDSAVAKKISYLQSDDVFAYEQPVQNDNAFDDSLMSAFTDTMKPVKAPLYQQPVVKEVVETAKASKASALYGTHEAEKTPEQAIREHKQNIAAKIAALRGVSLPGDYLHNK